jgi:hypothetical protein
MTRYWVRLGEELDRDEKWDLDVDAYEKELEELSNKFSNGAVGLQYVYVTTDLEDAKKVAQKAREINLKYTLDEAATQCSITSQPECPKCGQWGRFSDFYCSRCGAEMTEKGYFEPWVTSDGRY